MKKIFVCLLIVIVTVTGIVGISYFSGIMNYKKQVSNIQVSSVDLDKIPDGTYIGKCSATMVEAEVKVEVKDHRIINIDLLKHKNGKGRPAEVIPDKVVKAQSLNVDMVTGATSSSKVILKAIENALNEGASK